jgi:hypothetical protein
MTQKLEQIYDLEEAMQMTYSVLIQKKGVSLTKYWIPMGNACIVMVKI